MVKFVKLGDVCLVRRGTSITRKDTIEGKIPVIAGGRKATYYHNKQNRDSGTISISGSGASAGLVNYWSVPIFASDCSTVEVIDNKQNIKFVYYYLQSKQEFIYKNLISGAAQPHVYAKDIANLNYPILPIEEQLRIISKLDVSFAEIDKIINLTKDRIIKEKDLDLSALKSTFSTIKSKKTIGEIATVIAGQSPEGKHYNRDAKGVPFYQGKKEFGNYELKKPTVWTTKTTKEALKGDVLLSVRAPVGETNMNNDKICIGRGLAAIRANKDNNSEFIYYFLNSIKKQIVGNTGAVFNSINKKQIEDIVIPTQSLDEQNKTINKIKLILSYTKKINLFTKQKLHNLNILKSSILNHELKNRKL